MSYLNSIKNFCVFNSILSTISLFMYYSSFSYIFSSHLLRNYSLIELIEYSTKNNEYIDEEKRIIPKQTTFLEFDKFVFSTTALETLTLLFIKYFFYSNNLDINIFYDFLTFIPISFMYEIIFDLFHFNSHYIMHQIPYLYKNFHKIHHRYQFPSPIITFYQHPFDIFISNSIPCILTLLIIPIKPTYFQYIMISTYKVFIEISGHIGKKIKPTSFTQCIWIPRLLSIELKVEHHDLHHTINNCNYAKRFSLWDKVFGTFKSS